MMGRRKNKLIYIEKTNTFWREYSYRCQIASVAPNNRGYPQIKVDGRNCMVHRVVWEHFNGKIPDGLEINHIDGDKANFNISNLELVTHSENVCHSYRVLGHKGNGHRKIFPEDLPTIMWLREQGMTQLDIARAFGVSHQTISRALHGK